MSKNKNKITKQALNLKKGAPVNKALEPKILPDRQPAAPSKSVKPPNVFKMMKSFGKDLS